jgi:hypothetical protein
MPEPERIDRRRTALIAFRQGEEVRFATDSPLERAGVESLSLSGEEVSIGRGISGHELFGRSEYI